MNKILIALVLAVVMGGNAYANFITDLFKSDQQLCLEAVEKGKLISEYENESYPAVLQDIQFHPVTDRILHVDFYQLFDDKKIAMDIPVRIVGNSIGVKLGGNLQRNRRKLRIKALPANLPDYIEIDITELNIGNRVYVKELLNDSYEFLHWDKTVVCQVRRARAALALETDEEGEGEEGEEGSAEDGASENKDESSKGDAPAES